MDQAIQFLYISNMTRPDQIRSYNLFGETAEVPDIVHCETIQSRSQLHNWELRPHRHARLHQILLIETGGGVARIDDAEHALTDDVVINVPRGHVHGFRFTPQTQGWVVTLSSDLVDESLHPGEGLGTAIGTACLLPLTADLHRLAQLTITEYGNRDYARAQVLRSMAGLMLGFVARAIHGMAPADTTRNAPLFQRFETLVDAEFRNRLPVAEYARRLAVSPTHLNRIVRQATGRPASELISERMLREARRLLIYTTLSAAEIGYELGFADPAHFSRVFTRGVGTPPRAFRQRMEAQ